MPVADELRHGLVRRLSVELRRGRELQHPALVHHGNPVGKRHRFGLVVRDVDHRRAGALVEARELALHCCAQMHVEIGERLVEQHERRLGDETAGKRHPLALSAREQRRPTLGKAFELDQRERGLHALPSLGILHARHRQAVGDVLRDGHVRPQRIRLEHDPDAALLRRHLPFGRGHDRIADQDPPRVRTVESRDLPQHRGLAAARRPEDGDELAIRDRKRHVVERLERAVRLAKALQRQSRHGNTPFGNRPASSNVDSISVTLTTTVSMPSAAA
jgi:hypothetical protein